MQLFSFSGKFILPHLYGRPIQNCQKETAAFANGGLRNLRKGKRYVAAIHAAGPQPCHVDFGRDSPRPKFIFALVFVAMEIRLPQHYLFFLLVVLVFAAGCCCSSFSSIYIEIHRYGWPLATSGWRLPRWPPPV